MNWTDFRLELARLFDPHLWIVLAVVWCVLKAVHEIGHAVCAAHHGVRVGRMGIMFFLLAPLAYVDVTDAWRLPSRFKRVQIALAGVYFELAIGALAGITWWWLGDGFAKHLAAQIFLVAGPATLLINANPLLRLDGYYVLSDALEIPNLRMHGRSQLLSVIEHKLIGLPRRPALLTGWRRTFAVTHAACSIVFQIVWMGSLVIAVAHWARGLGVALGAVAVLVWGVIPLARWAHKIWDLEPRVGLRLSHYQRRLIGVATLLLFALQYLASTSSPLDRRVPVVVRYQNEQIARSPCDAFVEMLMVRCGERVSQGQLLVVLRQPELRLRRDQLNDQRELALSQMTQHRRRGEFALADSQRERSESLERQILELEEQLSGLRVTADRDGTVTSAFTDFLPGQFVQTGDPLIHVSDLREKELLALVSQADLTAFQSAAQRGLTADVRLRGGKRVETKLVPVRPQASDSLPHPALSASVGGPLAVEPDGDSGHMRLVNPWLQSVVRLDTITSGRIHAGQTGRLTIPDDRSFLSRLWDWLNTPDHRRG